MQNSTLIPQHLTLVAALDPGATLVRAWRLAGGVSAQVTALELAGPGGATRRLVLREYGAADLRRDPQIAEHEFRLLRALHAAGMPVPAPAAFDQSSALLPSPWLAIEYVDGAAELAPEQRAAATPQLAAALARLHRLDPAELGLGFLPRAAELVARALARPPAEPDDSLGERQIRAALAGWPPAERSRPALLHGDYWPGNVLWRAGRLAAMIDWEDAMLGDPLADLANCRLELLWAWGHAALQQFTAEYLAAAPLDLAELPRWELWAALRPCGKLQGWGLAPADEARMRELHRWFVAQALGRFQRGR